MDTGAFQTSAGLDGLTQITVTLICIAIAWWALQCVRFDKWLIRPQSAQAKLLQIILSIVLGYETSRFMMDYLYWSSVLKWLF
jgi:uncharacterized integral membrane protein (TIGR02327 family)